LKKFLLYITILFFSACSNKSNVEVSSLKTLTAPSWYLHVRSNKNYIIGYAEASSREEAFSLARSNIAKKLKIEVETSSSIKESVENLSTSKYVKTSIYEKSNVEMINLKVLKEERINGYFFVALEYDNSSIYDLIRDTIDQKSIGEMDENNVYFNTYLSSKLKEYYSFVPDYSVEYDNATFFVLLGSQKFALKSRDIKLLFFEHESQFLSIVANNKSVKNEDYFYFRINFLKEGYLSLFNIDEEGKVISMYLNKFVLDGSDIFPNLDKFEGLQAKVLTNRTQSIEKYIVSLCSNKKDFAIFDEVSNENYNINLNAQRLDTLYPLLEDCAYSSTLVKIIKNNLTFAPKSKQVLRSFT